MELNLKFKKGQKVFVRIGSKYYCHTITGPVDIHIDAEGNISEVYEIDRSQLGYGINERVYARSIFTSVQEVMHDACIDELDDSMLA